MLACLPHGDFKKTLQKVLNFSWAFRTESVATKDTVLVTKETAMEQQERIIDDCRKKLTYLDRQMELRQLEAEEFLANGIKKHC